MSLELPFFNPHSDDPDELRRAILQLFIIGFYGFELPDHIATLLGEGLGGVILFRRNVDDVEQVATLNTAIHAAALDADAAPFVSVDQEGGRVVRVREPLTEIPPMRAVGQTGDPGLAADVAEVIADEVAMLGFNMNFSPVLDVDTNPANPVIGDRAFSDDPETVAAMGGAFIAGHLASGVIPCGKHFPGHGDTDTDSHLTLPSLPHDLERLESVELYPFKRLIDIEIPMLMTAHIVVPAIDSEHPATLSRAIMGDLLRGKMQYRGVVVTDDLEMNAVAENYDIPTMIELGLDAGVDIFMICHTHEKFTAALTKIFELSDDPARRARIFESANRVIRLKKSVIGRWPRPWVPEENWREVVGCATHFKTMERVQSTAGTGADPTEWRT